MKPVIIPAIIATSQTELDEILNRLKGKVDRVQLDIMDGRFVPTRSLDWDLELPEDFVYEVHTMATDPLDVLRKLSGRAQIALLHYESGVDPRCTVKELKSLGFKVYLALNPDTPTDVIEPYLDELDGVLVMTVYPGRYGAPFIPKTLDKVRRIRSLRRLMDIEVDGAMNPENITLASAAGANLFVSGSYILKSVNPSDAIKRLTAAAEIEF